MTPPRRPPDRRRVLSVILRLLAAAAMFALGGLWTAQSWGLLGMRDAPAALDVLGPAIAGLGVALAWISLSPPR